PSCTTRLLPFLVALTVLAVALAAPAAPLRVQGRSPVLDQLAREVKIGQMLMAGVVGLSLTDDARHAISDLHVGNVVLMRRNVDAPRQVPRFTRDPRAVATPANGAGVCLSQPTRRADWCSDYAVSMGSPACQTP
ncbi:MAG: hypothetical protein IT307_18120, partial [Chloroflexi bacterium]|nr:hypothetical protein [Chloroflexota bacterium]